jgi:undecaprenyl diphosphate synthase
MMMTSTPYLPFAHIQVQAPPLFIFLLALVPLSAAFNIKPPKHVALICDGNSRWAEQRNLHPSLGHAKGAEVLTSSLRHFRDRGVKICTFYGFSTENWSRSRTEINDIWTVMESTAISFYDTAIAENVRVRILGDLDDDRIPISLRDTLTRLEIDSGGGNRDDELQRFSTSETQADGDDLTVYIAVNYGGRSDIVNAGKRIANMVKSGEIMPEDIDESLIKKCLCTYGIPDPELIIRTGGEQRLSNFLLWDLAYSELYFSEKLWPEFDATSIDDALEWYASRCRRFGGRKLPAAMCHRR